MMMMMMIIIIIIIIIMTNRCTRPTATTRPLTFSMPVLRQTHHWVTVFIVTVFLSEKLIKTTSKQIRPNVVLFNVKVHGTNSDISPTKC